METLYWIGVALAIPYMLVGLVLFFLDYRKDPDHYFWEGVTQPIIFLMIAWPLYIREFRKYGRFLNDWERLLIKLEKEAKKE
jgi:hypothetical protein